MLVALGTLTILGSALYWVGSSVGNKKGYKRGARDAAEVIGSQIPSSKLQSELIAKSQLLSDESEAEILEKYLNKEQ